MQAATSHHTAHSPHIGRPSLWPSSALLYLLVSVACAVVTLTVLTAFKTKQPNCSIVITGHSVSVLGCDQTDVAKIVQSFSWSKHDGRLF
uniref:Movement protein TGBp3 n=1 Tax=Blackberry calico virus TaxID=3069585 RepID=A0AA50DIJ5_9VIRU|nr:triple gene block protein 3 [Blackberry calico virus]